MYLSLHYIYISLISHGLLFDYQCLLTLSIPVHHQTISITIFFFFLFNPIVSLKHQNQGLLYHSRLFFFNKKIQSFIIFSSGVCVVFWFQELNRFRLFSMAFEQKESPDNNSGLQATPDEATKGYFMQQTVGHFGPFYLYLIC